MPESVSFSADGAGSLGDRAYQGPALRAELMCPMTGEPMHDAVVLLANGNTYSRQSLVKWFANRPGPILLIPGSQTPLTGLTMVPNLAVRRIVSDDAEAQGIRQAMPPASERGLRQTTLDSWDTQAASLPLPAQRHLVKVQAHLLFVAEQIPAELLVPTTRELPPAWTKIIDEISGELSEDMLTGVKLACQNVMALADRSAASELLPLVALPLPAPGVAGEPINWGGSAICMVTIFYAAWTLNEAKVFSVRQQRQCIQGVMQATADALEKSFLENPSLANPPLGNITLGNAAILITSPTVPLFLVGAGVISGYTLALTLRHRTTRRVSKGGFCLSLTSLVGQSHLLFLRQAQSWCESCSKDLTAYAERPFDFHSASHVYHLDRFLYMGLLESVVHGSLFMVAVVGGFLMRSR